MMLITIEYEECRFGIGPEGPAMSWFPVIETFREGHIDDPLFRANNRRTFLLARSGEYRHVLLTSWKQSSTSPWNDNEPDLFGQFDFGHMDGH